MVTPLFVVFAAGLLSSAIYTVTAREASRSVMGFLVSAFFLTGLYLLLDASFIASVQILVAASASVVFLISVTMMVDLAPEVSRRPAYLSMYKLLGTAAMGFLAYRLAGSALSTSGSSQEVDGNVRAVGELLFSQYLVGFEAVAVLFVVATVGAVTLGMKRLI